MGATMLTLHCGLRLKTAAIGLGILLAMTPMAAAKTVINVMLNTQTPQATELMTKELIPAFEKAYPDISVQFSTLDWNTRDQKLRVLYAGGVAPDVIEIGSDTIIGDVANGFPLALDNRINSWAGRADLIPETWQPSKWNGHQYGVPYTLTGRELFYLTSVFDEAGLNSAKAPRSWEDLKDYTRKLTITSGDGTMKRLGLPGAGPNRNLSTGIYGRTKLRLSTKLPAPPCSIQRKASKPSTSLPISSRCRVLPNLCPTFSTAA